MSTDSGEGFEAVIDGILGGALAPVEAATEGAWLDTWRARSMRQASPIATAAAAGAQTDRPAWVFLAGYQAGLQRCFPEANLDGSGFSAYAISEDREGTLPGVTVRADGAGIRLSGTKTWLAACDHVRTIIVTAGFGPERRFYLVGRDAAGVRIEARPAPGFLGELSQGRITFEETPVGPDSIIAEWTRAVDFAVAEPLHVLTALNACMLSQLRRLEAPSYLSGGPLATLFGLRETAKLELTSNRVALALVGLEATTRASADAIEPHLAERDPAYHERWLKDRRLVGMFTASVRRRADALDSTP